MEVFSSDQSNQPQVNFIREGVKIGLINGAIALLLMYGSYYAGLDTFVTVQFISRFIPYMMIILIIYGFQLRIRNGGYLTFRDALKYSFMSYVVVAVMVAIGTYILFNLIDKDLTQKSFDLSMEKMKSTFTNMGMKEEEIEKAMGKKESQKTDFPTIFLGTGFGLIWDFVVSLLISLIIRREKPVF
jgi:hypothetical protein